MSDDNWKQKYLDNLDVLEKREKIWRGTEAMLKQGLSRVSLAAQGLDEKLDQDLAQLRKSIRGTIELDQLETVVENLSLSVTRLDEQRSGKSASHSPQDLLTHWLDTLSLPREFKGRLKNLRQEINATADLAQIEAPLRKLAEIINNALQHEDADTTEASSGGLFSRLFGGGEERKAPLNPEAQRPGVQVGQFCVQLLDTLTLPAELSAEVESLKDKLAEGLTSQSIAPALTAIADLISTMRQQMENENKELQDFLRQLTENLKELDQNLAGAQTHHSAGVHSGRELNAEVHKQVKEIEATVEGAPESSQLKQQIQVRLDAIRRHLDQYRHSEESRQQQLEAQLVQLNGRIHNMESEGEQLRERLQEKHEQAVRDPLTGLHNRLAYDERVIQEFARWKRYGQAMVLMMIDVDHFKRVNDDYGHKAGDKALVLIADQLKNNLRESDFLARYGGEEFVVLMPGTELEPAMIAAEKLRAAVEQCQFHYQGVQVPITVSSGLAQLREDDNTEKLFQRADQAMYHAKSAGRNRCATENDTEAP